MKRTLDSYLQLANHAARWANPRNPFAVHPTLRPYMQRVPKERIGAPVDRQFWFGEVLDDLRRNAERDLGPAEMKRFDHVIGLMLAKPPAGYGSTVAHSKVKKSGRQLDHEIAHALTRNQSDRSHATAKGAKSKHADLIFRNAEDTLRVRIFRRDSGRWDYDVFTKGRGVETYSTEAGDDFTTRGAAKWHALENTDASLEISPTTVTEGW